MKSQQHLETSTLTSNLEMSIAIAFERTQTTPFDIANMVKDISEEFEGLNELVILKAIKRGALGDYGYTYKLSTQQICIWIREYKKEKGMVKLNMNVKP